MINLKSEEEIERMSEGGEKLRKVVYELKHIIAPGISTREIDAEAEKLIKKHKGEPSFSRVAGYRWCTCLPINDEVVHTPPSERVVKEGDILTLDIGMFYNGFHTDFADTYAIGRVDKDTERFLEVGKKALHDAINKVKQKNRIGEISQTIERVITTNGYSIIKELTGHGIGKDLHEDPYVPGYLDRPIEKTVRIKKGLVIAVEVIYAKGKGGMIHDEKEEWSIKTADGSLSACFEHTVAVTGEKSSILT